MDEEEKIIEEIKRRVLEEEERLKKNREKESVLEALESVTHLSKEQILAIEAQVRKENELRKIQKNKRKRLLLTISSMLLVLMVIVVWQLYERTLPPKIVPLLHDTFDEPTSSLWTEKQVYDYRKIHENGAYSFDVGKNWCYWDNVSLYFPENYTIEVHSVWQEGSYQTFGVMLLQDNKNYSLFQMSLAQKAAYVESIDGNYNDFVAKDAKVQVGENVQKIVVVNGQFSYFINDELVETGNLNANFNYVMLALRVCGIQKVNFTYVSVKNDDTGKYILKEDFRKPHYEWDFEQNYTTKFSFIDGQYRLDVKDKGYCNFNT
ncbi:MAG: hypothetical protein NZ521_10410, partial [Flammeovirgaceae bacterium]|nr:hypothetical protein [Flammeovirgaceae bacterium]MDW8288635.1 hypothetical protein [Flammeovirgaceae bacterium]